MRNSPSDILKPFLVFTLPEAEIDKIWDQTRKKVELDSNSSKTNRLGLQELDPTNDLISAIHATIIFLQDGNAYIFDGHVEIGGNSNNGDFTIIRLSTNGTTIRSEFTDEYAREITPSQIKGLKYPIKLHNLDEVTFANSRYLYIVATDRNHYLVPFNPGALVAYDQNGLTVGQTIEIYRNYQRSLTTSDADDVVLDEREQKINARFQDLLRNWIDVITGFLNTFPEDQLVSDQSKLLDLVNNIGTLINYDSQDFQTEYKGFEDNLFYKLISLTGEDSISLEILNVLKKLYSLVDTFLKSIDISPVTPEGFAEFQSKFRKIREEINEKKEEIIMRFNDVFTN